MTMQYAVFDTDLAFLGIFESKENAHTYVKNMSGATIQDIQVLPSTLIHHSDFAWPMYEVRLNDNIHAWVQAGYPWSAVVEVATFFGITICDPHLCLVREYANYTKGHGKNNQKPPVTYRLSSLMAEILSYVTPENKDLCAHLLEGMEEYQTVEGMRLDSQNSPTPTTAQGIRDQMAYIWHEHKNWMFLEETGATMSIQRLVEKHRHTQDPTEALFWTFVLSMWGGQCCFDPYTLYQCITQHKFDKFWADLQGVRSLLGGK